MRSANAEGLRGGVRYSRRSKGRGARRQQSVPPEQDRRTSRSTEWRPRNALWRFESQRGAAIGELAVRLQTSNDPANFQDSLPR